MSAVTPAPKKLIIKPIIISNNKKMVIKSPKVISKLKFPVQQYKEEVIFASSDCDFLKGESQDVLIVNRLNMQTKSCRTIARCTIHGVSVETTSDRVSSVIGQKNYDTVLSALSSLFNEETKVRGILALLTAQKKLSTVDTQTEMQVGIKKDLIDVSCQTMDTRLNMFIKEKQRKRIRRQPLTPYVVMKNQSKLKKFVINVTETPEKNTTTEKKEEKDNLPDLKLVLDEDSNMSSVSNVSLSSLPSLPGVLENRDKIIKQIDKVTDKTLNSSVITLRDGSTIMVPVKPEDMFHIATPNILNNVTPEERMKIIWHQAFIDFKMCLEQDEDGYYPLHIAVLNNDADLVRRQCVSLRARHESVDILASGMTALHMAVRQNASTACTNILLQNGADPLLCEQERRCSVHLAAEAEGEHLRALLGYCGSHARSVLKNNMDFWRPELESKSDAELTRYLFDCISEMFDDQGYTPLMTAAEAGIPGHVSLLAGHAGARVDAAAPNCGATALYRAVARACLHAKETGNRISTPDKYLKTIEILVEHGADPSIENHSGSSVNSLLTEFSISALSMTIANKMTVMRHGKPTNDLNMILYKHNDGRIGYKDINNVTDKKSEMTEVKPIPPNLHAIITIDLPKPGLRNKSGDDFDSSKKDKIDMNIKAKSSKNVVSSEIEMGVRSLLKRDNLVIKDKIKVGDVTLNELGGSRLDTDTVNANTSYNTLKDKKADNLKSQQVKLSSVILKHAKEDPSIIIDSTVEPISSDKNATLDTVRISLKQARDGNGRPVFKRVSAEEMMKLKQAHPNVSKVTSNEINSQDMNLDIVSKQKVGNIVVKEADSIEKGFNVVKAGSRRQFKLIVQNAIDKASIDVAAIAVNESTSHAQDTKINHKKRNTNQPTRSAKERKTDNVVIVQNVALKQGYPLPNILKSGSKRMKPKDVVITNKIVKTYSNKAANVSPQIVIGKDDVDTAELFRKSKIRSE